MQESVVFLVRVQRRCRESSRSLSHLLMSFLFINVSIMLAYDSATKTRNSSGDEIANVNVGNDDIVHALQNAIDSCMISATDRRGYVLEHGFTKFSEITQCNGHYAVQGHSRSPILVPI